MLRLWPQRQTGQKIECSSCETVEFMMKYKHITTILLVFKKMQFPVIQAGVISG